MSQSEPVTLALGSALLAAATTAGAVAAPLSLAAVAAGSAGAAGLLGSGLLGSGLVTSLALTGASVGLSLLSQALASQGGGPLPAFAPGAGANSPDIRYTTRQPVPSKRVAYGYVHCGGAMFLEQVEPPYLYIGYLISAREVDAFEALYVGNQRLSFAALAPGSILVPLAISGEPDYAGHLRVSLRLGTADQAKDPLVAAAFPALSSEYRQRGIATIVAEFEYPAGGYEAFQGLWGQVARPNLLALVRGCKVYDPRDPTQDRDDAQTWKFSNNAALVQADYLRADYGGRIPASRMDWDKIAAAAGYDDELVGCKDGTFIRRHTIDGMVTLNQPPSEVMQGMLTANRGFVLQSGSRVWLSSSRPREPVVTIHDGLLAGPFELRAAKPKRDLVNKARVRFVAEEREYQTADGPILSRADLQAADDEVLDATLTLPFTLDHRRAQRLQKAFLASSRLGRQLSCRVDLKIFSRAADELIGAACRVSSRLFPQADGIYLIQSVAFADNFATAELALAEYDAAIERDWSPADDEQDFELADLDLS